MKKVRFETPVRGRILSNMDERECHSPRPFTERQMFMHAPDINQYPKVLPYSRDPEQLFDNSNSIPYPTIRKTTLTNDNQIPEWSPCSDLDISLLDANSEPRKPTYSRSILKPSVIENNDFNSINSISKGKEQTLTENKMNPPNILLKDDNFFIKRDNLGKMNFELERLSLDKENNPLVKKAQIIQMNTVNQPQPNGLISRDCNCHHCVKNITPIVHLNRDQYSPHTGHCNPHYIDHNTPRHNGCMCSLPPPPNNCLCCNHTQPQQTNCKTSHLEKLPSPQVNAVDKKTWAIKKYEQSKKSNAMEVEKQTIITKEKREPTVSDLFKIIKLQNEQLQLLQEKVDKFISTSQQNHHCIPTCNTEHVAIEAKQHNISIGVMTSFEMVRTSTIINKEVVKTNENAQIQCNRSQISIKEVVSKSQSPNLNFLDGIAPVVTTVPDSHSTDIIGNVPIQNVNEEKTLNELSLYNVQVDNATTPLMSPEQSLYLDVRDYSESEAESECQSNVGWTYYNKVMSHVNGMLQDSDMPSSASALYRNTRQQLQTVQMQIDKTNVSVTKRVKFGDDPLGIHQPHIFAGATDTSIKMNQLAAKYLKGAPLAQAAAQPAPRTTVPHMDMSFATRNYMERHRLLQNVANPLKPSPADIPKFLDITALKQQPKFL